MTFDEHADTLEAQLRTIRATAADGLVRLDLARGAHDAELEECNAEPDFPYANHPSLGYERRLVASWWRTVGPGNHTSRSMEYWPWSFEVGLELPIDFW